MLAVLDYLGFEDAFNNYNLSEDIMKSIWYRFVKDKNKNIELTFSDISEINYIISNYVKDTIN